jgi:hypothetical protein
MATMTRLNLNIGPYGKNAYWFQRRRFLNIFPIGSYVKTMSADVGHLGWRTGSHDIILKVDHLRTIHAMFKPVSQFKASMAWMVLKWSIFKIVSGDPDLHPRWPPSADIVLA